MQRIIKVIIILFCYIAVSHSASVHSIELVEQDFIYNNQSYLLKLPKGFKLELLTDDPEKPRLITFDQQDNMFLGSKSGNVYRLQPPYNNATVFTRMENYPHSIAFSKKYIFIAQTDGVYRAEYSPSITKLNANQFSRIARLPDTGGHSSRTIARGPDGLMYVSLGISGNCSDEYLGEKYDFDIRKGGFFVFNPGQDSPELEIFASGLRNPVGFDWHPQTNIMYSSNNGPDHLGFDLPPEYFSEIKKGSFHGMPWYQYDGKKIFRDNCIKAKPPHTVDEVEVPVALFPARNAPMGVSFLPENSVFNQFKNSAVVALRGSWATRPDWNHKHAAASRRHPKLVLVKFNQQHKAETVVDLVTGFQFKNGNRLARPVGVNTGPDGALYFTSDYGIEGLFRIVKQK